MRSSMSPLQSSALLLLLISSSVFCSKPRLEIIPSNGEIYLGTHQSFICKSTVEATMKWLNADNGEELEDEEGRYKKNEIDETTLTLMVTAAKIESDRLIRCEAESESGETTHADIKVKIIQRPTFVKMETEKEFNAGSAAQLHCAVKGRPTPQVTWIRNDMAITLLPGRVSATQDGTLTIKNIQLEDAGLYYCQAYIRDRNEVAYQNVSVTVNAAPVVSFEESFPNVTAKSNASFTCFVTGHPKPNIFWKKGEEAVNHDGQKFILSSNGLELSITDLAKEDEGEYTCYASNTLGEHNTTLTLQVIDQPKGLGLGLLIGIILLVVLMTLLAVDLTCYRTRRRGFLMFISTTVLGRPQPRAKLEESDIKKQTSDKCQVVKISGIDA